MIVRFTSLHAYPLFDSRVAACVGGAETHAWLLATGLARHSGFNVHFVVRAPRRFRHRRFGSVTVWNIGDGFDSLRHNVARSLVIQRNPLRIRILRPDPQLLWQVPLLAGYRLVRGPQPPAHQPAPAYLQVQPDVECCFGVSAQSAAAATAARRAGSRSILFLESNSDLDHRFSRDSTYLTPHGERGDVGWELLQSATCIVAQHTHQQQLLRERFGRESIVLPNLIDVAAWDAAAAQPSPLLAGLGGSRYVLWIGRADDFHKRPRLAIELARRLPQIPFLMVLNPGNDQIEHEIRAARPQNVTIVPAVPYSEMPAVLSAAAVYVSTGSVEYEGSPNLFLQAAASRIPVASLEVTTPLLVGTGAGFVAGGDLEGLADYVARMYANPAHAQASGAAGRRIVEQQHALEVVVGRFIALLRDVQTASGPTSC